MRTQKHGTTIKVWLSASETYAWAHRAGNSWPCSQLSGHRIFAEFDRGNLVDLAIDGRSRDIDVNEFNAIIEDKLGSSRPGEA